MHYQRFADALRITQDTLDSKNFYAFNPAYTPACPSRGSDDRGGCGCSGRS